MIVQPGFCRTWSDFVGPGRKPRRPVFSERGSYYRKARDDERGATARLNEMIANYGDVIPRRDFEGLEKNFNVSFSPSW